MPKRKESSILTNLELEVMQVVWESTEPLTVRQVCEQLNHDKERFAYTTIQTMMLILKRKGVVTSHPGPGRAHLYQARLTRNQVTKSMLKDFIDRLFGGHAEPLLQRLVSDESLSSNQLEDLKRLIETKLSDEEDET